MRRRFAIQLKYVLWAIIAAFIIGLPLVFVPSGANLFRGMGREEAASQGSSEVVATVDGKPVTSADVKRDFDRVAGFYAQMGQELGLSQLWQLRYAAFEQAIQDRLLVETAQRQGISVSKGDLKQQARQSVDKQIAQLKQQYKEPQLGQVFAMIVAKSAPAEGRSATTMSERQFSNWMMDRLLDPSEGLRDDLTVQKLRQSVTAQASATEQDLLQSYDKATVRHIVIALNPAAKAGASTPPPARTDEQAKKRADELLARVKGGEDFAAVAKAESDDPGAAQSGGLMENVSRGRMSPEWDKAVFALKPGEVSAPIKLQWGYEIVRMEGMARQLPKDFEKNKAQLLASFQEQRRGEVWQRYVSDLRQKAKVDVRSAEMQGYQALMQGKTDEALVKLTAAKEQAQKERGIGAASVFYELGQLLAQKKKWSEASDAFGEAADAVGGADASIMPGARGEALMAMANAYEQLGQNQDAIMWYTAASDQSESPMVHSQLVSVFNKLGKPDLAKKEQQWMADYEQQQKQRQAQMEAQQKAALQKAQPQPTKGASPTPAPARPTPTPSPQRVGK